MSTLKSMWAGLLAGKILLFKGQTLKGQLLVWAGIFGGTFTLFSSLGTMLGLADWARLLVIRWQA